MSVILRGVQSSSKMWHFFGISCAMTILCSSLSHAVYDVKNHKGVHVGGINPPSNDGHPSSLGGTHSSSSTEDLDRIAWEYIINKYSTSKNGLTPEELMRLTTSMRKCQGNQRNNNNTHISAAQAETSDTFPVDTDPMRSQSRKAPTGVIEASTCDKIIDSVISFSRERTIINQSSFKELCPRLLFFTENEECCSSRVLGGNVVHNIFLSDKTLENLDLSTTAEGRGLLKKEKPSSSEVWGYGILLVTIISCSSLVGVSLMPFMAKDFYKHLLTVMIGLAVGSLTGSAVFHLLPQALRLGEHDPNHGYLHISLVIVGGIWLFFMVERILKFIMDYKERRGKNWKREKMASICTNTPESSSIAVMTTENGNVVKGPLVTEASGEQRSSLIFPATPRDTGVIYECQEQAIKASFGHQEKPRAGNCHDHHVTFEQGKDSVIATVAWMIIFGDGLHNFIDGLSIGAAFNESIWTGVSISLAVLCEELPHELGDFAVLLNAGMSMRQAVTYNFLSACTCYIGMAVGILLGEIEASIYIFALAGGMFLYISLVDMVPEMNEIAQETSKVSVKNGFITLLLQNVGLFVGITALYLLALYQDSFQF